MRKLLKILSILGAAGAASVAAEPALAQGGTCGVTGTAVAPQSITYDPFSGAGLTQVSIPLKLTRFVGTQGAKTQQVNFVLVKPAGAPDYQVTYGGSSILYTVGNLGGHPQINSQAAGEVNFNFGGGNSAGPFDMPFPLVVTVPGGLDLSAGLPIEFDIVYVCDGTGGMGNVSVPATLPNAVRINVNVVSALQASYVGQTLNFGNVDNKTTAQVLAAPLDFATSATTNNVRVASSGPYKVEVQSTNNYKLKISNGTDTLNYQAYFLGQTLKPTTPTFTAVTCQRATISGVNLPIRARLVEGGVFKTPGVYSDTITVTISPLLDGATNQKSCSTMALPAL